MFLSKSSGPNLVLGAALVLLGVALVQRRAASDLVVSAQKGFQPESYVDGGTVYVVKSKDVRYPGFDLSGYSRTDETE